MKGTIIFPTVLAALLLSGSCVKEKPVTDGGDIGISTGTTVYGRVYSDDGPLKRAVVSDGAVCVQTDENGVYQLKSAKKNAIVFVCVPAYYTPERDAGSCRPKFWHTLSSAPDVPERHDFHLVADPDQDRHTRIVLGDIHVYNDASSSYFAKTVCSRLHNDIKAGVYRIPYGLTLGDMTWDWHWYSSGYRISQYLSQMDKTDFPVYSTVGNHDHDMKYNGRWWNSAEELEQTGEDWAVMVPYREKQGPTCYSVNIGKIHYISMDNALTTDDGTGMKDGRGCVLGFTDADLEWLRQDLKYVKPSRPVILSLHMPLSSANGSLRKAYGNLEYYKGRTADDMFAPFKDRNLMLVLSAHTHTLYTNDNVLPGGVRFREITGGAVCGNFWCSEATRKAGITICNDGTPAGYRVLRLDNETIVESSYMAIEKKGFYPFRSYDRNMIDIKSEAWAAEAAAAGMRGKSQDNYVYINVFDWTDGWKIEVSENGKALGVQSVGATYDPLALEMADKGILGSLSKTGHPIFRVKASSADATLVIRVTDPYGNTATETMTRPKEFSWTSYAKEDYSL